MKRLYQDCGWRNVSIYRCNICNIIVSDIATQIDDYHSDYKSAFPLIEAHIKENHPEHCFICIKCDSKHISITNLKKCCKKMFI